MSRVLKSNDWLKAVEHQLGGGMNIHEWHTDVQCWDSSNLHFVMLQDSGVWDFKRFLERKKVCPKHHAQV